MNATATAVPAGTQNMRALVHANRVRIARAGLKRRVAHGEVDVADIIACCPWEADSMALSDLLMSQRHWGHTRSHNALAQVPVADTKTVGSMTDRQRHVLASILGSAKGM